MIDVTSATLGLSVTSGDLIHKIQSEGWEVTKVEFNKTDKHFVAEGKNEHGEKISKFGPTDAMALGHLLVAAMRHNHMRSATIRRKLGSWETSFKDDLQSIAEAYAKSKVWEADAAAAFKALADDSVRRAETLKRQLHIEVTNDPTPYKSLGEMVDDIHKNKHFEVSRANAEHPIWSTDQVIAFRIVHDIMGHAVSGGGFDWDGENLATASHMAMLDPIAQQALFTQTIANTAYQTYYHSYQDQKIVLLPQFIEEAQDKNNKKIHRGIHPSQISAPESLPGLPKIVSASDSNLADPNANWESGIEPNHTTTNGLSNAYLEHDDPLNIQGAQDNAGALERRWWEFKTGDGKPDLARMEQAVANALRVAILSPQKELRHNAIQYQHLQTVPAHVDDPQVYWDTLENHRQNWNADKYGEEARFLHRPWHYKDVFKKFVKMIAANYPEEDAQAKAERIVNQWVTEEQERERRIEGDLPEEKKRPLFDIDNAAYKAVATRMVNLIKEKQPNLDHFREASTPDEPEIGMSDIANAGRYGAFMGTHLKAIAKVGQNIQAITEAALEDVTNHDGSGHHFRSTILQLQVPFVGPKVASFAWLLLCPNSSELATVDTHIMDMLGIKSGSMPNRDYFKAERQFRAGMDAAGYGNIPLGQAQWAAWDWKRTGQSQDHSPIAVDEPTPYDQVMWHPITKDPNIPKGQDWVNKMSPDWWNNTQDARDQVGTDFDTNIGSRFPKTAIPYQGLVDSTPIQTLAAIENSPDDHDIPIQNGGHEYVGRGGYSKETSQPWAPGQMGKAVIVNHQSGPVFHLWGTDQGWPHHTHIINSVQKPFDRFAPKSEFETISSPLIIQTDGKYDPSGLNAGDYAGMNNLIPKQFQPDETGGSDWRFGSSHHTPSPGEFHASLKLPDGFKEKIKAEVDKLDIDMEPEVIDEYHMTWLFIKDDNGFRGSLEGDCAEGNIEQSGEFHFDNARLHKFPAREEGDKDTVVIRFDSEEARKMHDIWEKEDEEKYGIDPGPFAGDFKPHISIGWTNDDIPSGKLPLEFTSEGFEVSPGATENSDDYVSHIEDIFEDLDLDTDEVKNKAEDIKKALKQDELPEEHVDSLMKLYAHLALTKGKTTSLENVHDAWSYWTLKNCDNPDHESLVPFDELTKKIQDYDEPYAKAIRKSSGSKSKIDQLRERYPGLSTAEIWQQVGEQNGDS